MGRTKRSYLQRNRKSDDFGYTWVKYKGEFQLKISKYQIDKWVLYMATYAVAI